MKAIGIYALLLTTALAAPPVHNNRWLFELWGKIKKPFPGKPESIGTYAAGCLAGARTLPIDGPGYAVMRLKRERNYGHPDLISFLSTLGKKLKEENLGLLLVGDMGRARGGPMPTGHSSHQIGLDVDLWYRMSKKRPSKKEREEWSADSFVTGENQDKLSPAWNDSYRRLVALAAESPFVNRIFVHPVIKRDFCEHFKDAPWLYKLRAWWAHHDHLHVRLNCAEGASSCKGQEALDPKNTQCGTELDWWFSQEAKDKGKEKEAAFAERNFPELPADCDKMVKGLKVNGK